MFSARIADFMLPTEKFLPLLTLHSLIFDKVSEWFAAAWMAKFTQGLGFNLADPLAGYIEDLADIF